MDPPKTSMVFKARPSTSRGRGGRGITRGAPALRRGVGRGNASTPSRPNPSPGFPRLFVKVEDPDVPDEGGCRRAPAPPGMLIVPDPSAYFRHVTPQRNFTFPGTPDLGPPIRVFSDVVLFSGKDDLSKHRWEQVRAMVLGLGPPLSAESLIYRGLQLIFSTTVLTFLCWQVGGEDCGPWFTPSWALDEDFMLMVEQLLTDKIHRDQMVISLAEVRSLVQIALLIHRRATVYERCRVQILRMLNDLYVAEGPAGRFIVQTMIEEVRENS